jgi:hypothetical protein
MFVVRATAHIIQRRGQTDPTNVWGVLKMLFTAYHGSAAPAGPWRGPHRRAERAKHLVK